MQKTWPFMPHELCAAAANWIAELRRRATKRARLAVYAGDLAVIAEAKSDLVNVLSRLEAHWVVLEAELVEINKDITFSEQCVQKYGCVVRSCVDEPKFLLRLTQ